MEVVNLIQGSPEWDLFRREHYPASEAPSMMGVSKFNPKTPEELALIRLGLKEIVISDFQQKIFDEGHAMEECARPIVEKLIKEPLSNMIGKKVVDRLAMPLAASLDGLTFDGEIVFEHKKWNEKLAKDVRAKKLSPAYTWQLDQQLVVSGAKKVIFVTSDAFKISQEDFDLQKETFAAYSDPLTDQNGEIYYMAANYFEYMEYTMSPDAEEQLISGWERFEEIVAEVLADDEGWNEAAEKYLGIADSIQMLKDKQKKLEEQLKPYKTSLINSAKTSGSSKMIGGGVEVTQVTRKGGLDEKKLLELLTPEQVESCRKDSSVSWQVKASKTNLSKEQVEAAKKTKKKMGDKKSVKQPTVVPSTEVQQAGLYQF